MTASSLHRALRQPNPQSISLCSLWARLAVLCASSRLRRRFVRCGLADDDGGLPASRSDLSANTDIFNRILGYFSDVSGTLRDAAAFAAGNMAVGSPKFLQPIVQRVETATDQNDRLLSLHALREVRSASRLVCTSSR